MNKENLPVSIAELIMSMDEMFGSVYDFKFSLFSKVDDDYMFVATSVITQDMFSQKKEFLECYTANDNGKHILRVYDPVYFVPVRSHKYVLNNIVNHPSASRKLCDKAIAKDFVFKMEYNNDKKLWDIYYNKDEKWEPISYETLPHQNEIEELCQI